MTDPSKLLATCETLGIRLLPTGDGGLTIDGPRESLTPELIGRLRMHKTELLAMLTPPALPPPARPTPSPRVDVTWTAEDDILAARVLRLSPDDLPPPPFRRYPWSVVTDTVRFLEWLRRDVSLGPRSPRARYGVLRRDMQSILDTAARYASDLAILPADEGAIHDD